MEGTIRLIPLTETHGENFQKFCTGAIDTSWGNGCAEAAGPADPPTIYYRSTRERLLAGTAVRQGSCQHSSQEWGMEETRNRGRRLGGARAAWDNVVPVSEGSPSPAARWRVISQRTTTTGWSGGLGC